MPSFNTAHEGRMVHDWNMSGSTLTTRKRSDSRSQSKWAGGVNCLLNTPIHSGIIMLRNASVPNRRNWVCAAFDPLLFFGARILSKAEQDAQVRGIRFVHGACDKRLCTSSGHV